MSSVTMQEDSTTNPKMLGWRPTHDSPDFSIPTSELWDENEWLEWQEAGEGSWNSMLSVLIGKPVHPQADWMEKINQDSRLLPEGIYQGVKRLLDILIALAALPVVALIGLLCAVLIKFESPDGPIFFIQERTGKGGKRFDMFKFRTMVPNAEALKKELAPVNEKGELAGPLKLDYDPRITRVGRILRKTSLDELPQIINILKGDMSWVGPRPTSWGLQSYDLWHTERLDVLPGITGLWQLYGRGDVQFDNWVQWDVQYIDKRCLWLDIQIMLRTALAIVEQRGAR